MASIDSQQSMMDYDEVSRVVKHLLFCLEIFRILIFTMINVSTILWIMAFARKAQTLTFQREICQSIDASMYF